MQVYKSRWQESRRVSEVCKVMEDMRNASLKEVVCRMTEYLSKSERRSGMKKEVAG